MTSSDHIGGLSDYFAFISYKREDEKWARWLQRELEHYHIPASIRKEDASLPKEIRPVFKDTSELAAGVLVDEIRNALEQSKYLIVICSPQAAKSRWVSSEIQTFIDLGREQRIIPFVVDGKPFSMGEEECFPEPLLALHGERELLGINIAEMGRDAAAVKVVARMLGVKFDRLWQRAEREKRRRRILWIAASLLLVLASLGVAAYIGRKNVLLDTANRELETAYGEIAKERDRANQERDRANQERDRANQERDRANQERDRANAERRHAEAINVSLMAAYDSIVKQQAVILQQNQELQMSNWVAMYEYKKMKKTHSRSVAGRSREVGESGDYLLARKIALAALDDPPLPEAEAAMREAWNANGLLFKGHSAPLRFISYCSDGTIVASMSSDNDLHFWDPLTGEEIRSTSVSGLGRINSLSFSPNFRKMLLSYSSSEKKGTAVFDFVDNAWMEDRMYGRSDYAVFSPDGKTVVSGSPLTLWDVESGDVVTSFDADLQPEKLSFSPDGRLLAAISDDGHTVSVMDVASGKVSRTYKSEKGIDGISISPDNHTLAMVSDQLLTMDLGTGGLELKTGRDFSSVAYGPDGKTLAVGKTDGSLRILDADSGKELQLLKGLDSRISDILFSPDGKRVLTASSGHIAQVWDVNPYEDFLKVEIPAAPRGNTLPSISPDGRMMAQGQGNVIRLSDLQSGETLRDIEGDYPIFQQVSFSPDGKRLLSIDGRADAIHVWSAETGKELMSLEGLSAIHSAYWHPDGNRILLSGAGFIQVVDTRSGRIEKRFSRSVKDYSLTSASFHPDGENIVAGFNDALIAIIDTDTGMLYRSSDESIDPKQRINDIRYSPDGRLLAALCTDYSLRILDASTLKERRRLENESGWRSVSFSPDGRLILSEDRGGSAVWDVSSGMRLNHWDGYYNPVFTPDGNGIFAMKGDKDYLIEFPSIQDLRARTKKMSDEVPMTDEELERYGLGDEHIDRNDIDEWRRKNEKDCLEWIADARDEYVIPDDMVQDHPCLVYLVLHSRSLSDKEERQSWFDLYPLMNEDQKYSLYDILLREKEKLSLINNSYR